MKISELGPEDRPREKMLSKGAVALTPAELLAVIIGSGSDGVNALDVGNNLMRSADWKLSMLSARSVDSLRQEKGIGPTKALKIAAALELGRRFLEEGSPATNIPVKTPEQVFRYMIPLLKGLDHEESWIIFLNKRCCITGKERLSQGGGDSTVLDGKILTRMALEKRASEVILVHNHPSGNPYPSDSDIRETQALRKSLGAMDIGLLDHVIISDNAYYAFSENKVTNVSM